MFGPIKPTSLELDQLDVWATNDEMLRRERIVSTVIWLGPEAETGRKASTARAPTYRPNETPSEEPPSRLLGDTRGPS
jgi:hypothetical protein